MNWIVLSFLTLLLWGTYSVFANRANAVHGEMVTFLFETVAFIVIALVQFGEIRVNIGRVTMKSAIDATIMGAMSAGGFYLFLRALRLEPTRIGTIALITGLWPVITVFVSAGMGQQHLYLKDWIGAALATAGIVLVSL